MSIPDFVARQTERMADSLAHFIASTPADRLVWHPKGDENAQTRSMLEQIGECVSVNRGFVTLIRTGELSLPSGGWPDIHFVNGADAQEQLVMSARELAEALRNMTDDDLTRAYNHPRGPILGENLLLMCYRNMAYHAGQINFIQTLYGDTEFHVPPTWR
jgi:hypothetical protein